MEQSGAFSHDQVQSSQTTIDHTEHIPLNRGNPGSQVVFVELTKATFRAKAHDRMDHDDLSFLVPPLIRVLELAFCWVYSIFGHSREDM